MFWTLFWFPRDLIMEFYKCKDNLCQDDPVEFLRQIVNIFLCHVWANFYFDFKFKLELVQVEFEMRFDSKWLFCFTKDDDLALHSSWSL